MKVVLSIIGAVLVLMMFGTILTGITDAKTDERTDAFVVVTAPAAITAPVVLVASLYDGDILNVVSITSDVGTDAPLPDSYVVNTKTLTVRGLDDDETRTLTVTYRYDAMTGDAASAGTFLGFMPIFIAIALIAIIIGGIWVAWSNRS